jgi:hypothetical protein
MHMKEDGTSQRIELLDLVRNLGWLVNSFLGYSLCFLSGLLFGISMHRAWVPFVGQHLSADLPGSNKSTYAIG